MTRNLKKLLALVLVLAMAGSTMIVAWANTPDYVESGAAIRFEGAWDDGLVDPEGPGPDVEDPTEDLPEDPEEWEDDDDLPVVVPGDPELDPPTTHIASSRLDFWEHNIPTVQAALGTGGLDFHSIRYRNSSWDPNYDNNDASLAGMWIRANASGVGYEPWTVTVDIDGFLTLGGNPQPVLGGFRLDLFPFGNTYLGIAGHTPPTFSAVSINADPLSSAVVATEFVENSTSGGSDFVGGRNFEGRLNIPQNIPAADLASSQAEMTWTFNAGTPGS